MQEEKIVLLPKSTVYVLTWRVKVEDPVQTGTVLATLSTSIGSDSLVSDVSGKIQRLYPLKDIKNDVACRILLCDHTTIFHKMCTSCGANLVNIAQEDSGRKALLHQEPELKIRNIEAKKIHDHHTQDLISQRKLSLVLDLDKTVINTTHNKKFENTLDVNIFELDRMLHYVKLRPHTREFLEKMSKLYELHIFTHGHRLYAQEIANILDPSKRLFQDRIISRDELKSIESKTLSQIFPGNDTNHILIIDDNPKVWKEHMENLIVCKPFEYFEKESNLPGDPDLDDQLIIIGKILENIHHTFFASEGTHVHDILMEIKEQVFSGCQFCFSGIEKNLVEKTFSKKAIEFGAVYHETLNSNVTHLISEKRGTQKMSEAEIMPGVFIVHPEWFWMSIERFSKRSEMDYAWYVNDLKYPISEHFDLSVECLHGKIESIYNKIHEIIVDLDTVRETEEIQAEIEEQVDLDVDIVEESQHGEKDEDNDDFDLENELDEMDSLENDEIAHSE
jgi:FCP1-like phosphatase family protein